MGIKMDAKELLIYKRIDDILWFEWDPIGVNEFHEARDEYQGYLYQIYDLKKSKESIESVADELYKIETGNMGLLVNIERCRQVAKRIIEI